MNNINSEIAYKIDVIYGHCELNYWFEYVDGKMIGMGSKTTYNEKGEFVVFESCKTGLIVCTN